MNGAARKRPINLGIARISCPNDWLPAPVTIAPLRIAYQLNNVEITVKQTDAAMLLPNFGVCLNQCTRNSMEWDVSGNRIAAPSAACHPGCTARKF